MSLNWNISKVENWKEKQEKYYELMDHLIWGSLNIGLGKLTKSNAPEWQYRLNRVLIENGCYERMYTMEMIELFIGLETNVGSITAAEFDKVMKERHPERYKITRKQLER